MFQTKRWSPKSDKDSSTGSRQQIFDLNDLKANILRAFRLHFVQWWKREDASLNFTSTVQTSYLTSYTPDRPNNS